MRPCASRRARPADGRVAPVGQVGLSLTVRCAPGWLWRSRARHQCVETFRSGAAVSLRRSGWHPLRAEASAALYRPTRSCRALAIYPAPRSHAGSRVPPAPASITASRPQPHRHGDRRGKPAQDFTTAAVAPTADATPLTPDPPRSQRRRPTARAVPSHAVPRSSSAHPFVKVKFFEPVAGSRNTYLRFIGCVSEQL